MASIPTAACDVCIAPPALLSKDFGDALLLTANLNSHWLKRVNLIWGGCVERGGTEQNSPCFLPGFTQKRFQFLTMIF